MLRLLAILVFTSALASGLTLRPVSVSLFPPLSTNGAGSSSIESRFSFNVIGGNIGAVHGFELGGVFNIDRLSSSGCQLSGVFNYVGGTMRGVQLAAINITGGEFRGVQLASFNFTDGEFKGLQLGCINIAGNLGSGLQLGNVNVTTDVNGFQLGNVNIGRNVWGGQVGNVNVSGMVRGLLFGNVNVTGDFRGVIAGNVNVTHAGSGFMLGNVNICSYLDGEALGNVSIIGNGYKAISVWADEAGLPQLGAKLGSKHIYSLFALGVAPLADPGTRWLLAHGLGGHFPLKNTLFFDLDLTGYGMTSGEELTDWGLGTDFFAKLRPQLGFTIGRRGSIVIGPTLSMRLKDSEDHARMTTIAFGFKEGWLWQEKLWYQAWAGLMVGIQVN